MGGWSVNGPHPYLTGLLIVLTIASKTALGFAGQAGGTIIGQVRFHGEIPPPVERTVKQDPEFCGRTSTIQPIVVNRTTGAVKDVVVSIVGLERELSKARKGADLPRALGSNVPETVITNRNCAFMPRISGIRVRNILGIGNDDPVLHNTHISQSGSTVLNVALVPGQNRLIQRKIRKPGLLSIKCDKHLFMQGHLLAFDHPYFTITNEAGQFRISGVPPGRREITVWHEVLGTLRQEAIIPAIGEISVTFDYPQHLPKP